MIDIGKTLSLRGYDPLMLTHGSNKKVWANCNVCGYGRWVIYQDYRDLCWGCSIDNPERKKETNKKLSAFQTERYKDPEERRKTGDSIRKAYEDDPEYRIKVGLGSALSWKTPERLEAASDKFKELWEDPSYCEGMFTEAIRKKMSESRIKLLSTDEQREKLRQQRLNQKTVNRDTSIEIKMQNILRLHGYFFKTQIPICNICIPDIILSERQIIIQCDGDYWHNLPGVAERDRKQDKILTKNGWRVIRFWEHEINENIQDCLRKFEAIYHDIEYKPFYVQ